MAGPAVTINVDRAGARIEACDETGNAIFSADLSTDAHAAKCVQVLGKYGHRGGLEAVARWALTPAGDPLDAACAALHAPTRYLLGEVELYVQEDRVITAEVRPGPIRGYRLDSEIDEWATYVGRFWLHGGAGDPIVPVRFYVQVDPIHGQALDTPTFQVGHFLGKYERNNDLAHAISTIEDGFFRELHTGSTPVGAAMRSANVVKRFAPDLAKIVREHPLLTHCDGLCFRGVQCWHSDNRGDGPDDL
jgi:hypothetical protein